MKSNDAKKEKKTASAPDEMRMRKLVQSNRPAITNLNISHLPFIFFLLLNEREGEKMISINNARLPNWLQK